VFIFYNMNTGATKFLYSFYINLKNYPVKKFRTLFTLMLLPASFAVFQGCGNGEDFPAGNIQLISVTIGPETLNLSGANPDMPVAFPIILSFGDKLDTNDAKKAIELTDNSGNVPASLTCSADLKQVTLTPSETLKYETDYQIMISDKAIGLNGEVFPGIIINFSTEEAKLKVTTVTLNGEDFSKPPSPRDIPRDDVEIIISFSHPLDPQNYQSYFTLPGAQLNKSLSGDQKTVTLTSLEPLEGYKKFYLSVSNALTSEDGYPFDGFYNSFYTELDSTYKFPPITDEELLDLVQRQTFRYFYDFAHPNAGLARERNTSGDIVTIGGSGFGVMALVVGMDRGYITRQQGLDHLEKMLNFLETCDRFHGVWPHWLNGVTGEVHPFSTKDDGADLVETGFMIQGLMTMRQYLSPVVQQEQELIGRLNALIDGVEWDWFTRGGQNVLYWHWSPNYGWEMNMQINGYNEALIIYVMAASSSTHTIPASAYHNGYARNGGIKNGKTFYGYTLPLGWDYGGPLFFTHYSHLGLDPRNLQDQYANYWEQGVNMTLINRQYCIDNPKNYIGYREDSWGLTASDNPTGYSAHSPTNDLGTITPTAAVSALPYTPEESMAAIRHFYYLLGDKLWGEYGFYDAFDVTDGWWASSYIAIDQGPIICMVENHRTGLLWDLFMSAPEVQQGLDKLGFSY
jgi:hypothetical protein